MQKFVVTFYDEDRETILDRQEVEKGSEVKYTGKLPEKDNINGIEYYFVGWETTGNIQMVMEDINLYAKYEEGSKANALDSNAMYELSEANVMEARWNEVLDAGNKVSQVEKATRNMTIEEKSNLVNEIKEKGSVDLDRQNENERD